jgi:hypothetical protein
MSIKQKGILANLMARGSVVGCGTMLQTGRTRLRVTMRWIFFNWPKPSSRTVALGSTQPLTEMSTRNLPGGKRLPKRKADNLTAPSVSRLSRKMCEILRLITVWAFTASYRNSFTFFFTYVKLHSSLCCGNGECQSALYGNAEERVPRQA